MSSKYQLLFVSFCTTTYGLKLSPIQQQIHRVDIGSETQILSAAFKEAYAYIHTERLSQADGEITSTFELSQGTTSEKNLSEQVTKLKASIDRWSLLEEKLQQTIAPSSSKQYKVAVEEANHQVLASRALLGQLYLLNRQEFIAVQELQAACPSLWEYDVAIRSQYFDGWVDCYAALGHLYVKIGNTDAALETEREMLLRMPWMHVLVNPVDNDSEGKSATTSATVTDATTTDTDTVSTESSQLAVLLELWSLPPLERLSLADQTRRMWMAARNLRGELNKLVVEFVAASNKRTKLKLFLKAQELLETELDKFTNSAASAAMVSDAIFTSNTPSVELIDRMSHQDFSQSIGSEEFSQLRIKSRIAEFIRAFKMQIFTEAKLYFEAMDGVIEQGDAYFLPQAPSTTIDESSDNIVESDVTTSEAASRQQYASAIGFQSREAVRLTFQYSYIHSVKQPRDELKGLKSRSAFSSNRNRRTRREPTVDTNKTTQTSAPTNDKAIPIILSFFEKLHKAATFTNLLIIAILSVGAYFLFNKKEAKTALLRLDDISTLDWIEGCSTKKKSPQSNPMKGKDKDKKVKAIEDKRIRNRSTSSVPAICVSSSRDNSNLTMLVPRPSTENFTTQNASPHTTNTSSDAKPVSVNLSASSNHSSVIPSDIPLFESQNDISDSQNPKSMKISPSMETLLPHLQVEDQIAAENEGEWTALPSGGAVKSKHLKASEKKLGKVAQRGKTVSEYPLKQQLEMKHLDTSASVSATATTYINGNKPTNTMKGNAKPSVASKSNTNSSSGKQSASAQPRGTNNNTSLAIPTTTGDVVESSSNEASPKANVWAARRRASKEDANITGSIPHPLNGIPKKVTTKSLHSTDGEDITSESDSISSVTGGEQNYFNKRVENDLNQHDSAQQYHQQMIHHQQMQQQYQQHMMNQSAMLHQPHTAVLAQTTDMYGNVTNQNYIIFAPEVVYENVPIGMPSTGAYPGPFQQTASGLPSSSASVPDAVSASSHDVSDPGASGYSTSPQFYYCPSSVPIYDGQGGMASHMNTSINQVAYAYPFYPQQPQQGMPQSQTNTQSVSVPASPQRIATPRSSNGEISQYSPESLARLQQQQQQSQSVTIEDHLLLVQAIRVQIEYYFSIANLSRDYYLRGVMDDEGYVALGEINNFRRIRNMYANAHLMMEAIISSTQLEVLKNDVVDSVLANPSCLMTLSEQAIFETKIRSVHDKSLWNVPVVADENMNVGCSSPPI